MRLSAVPAAVALTASLLRAQTGAHACEADPASQQVYDNVRALLGHDTPKAIGLLNEALAKDPELVYAYQTLTEIYASQVFHDRAKLTENLRKFTDRCPDNVAVYSSFLGEVNDPVILRELTAKYRAAVEKRNTPGVAAFYPTLWAAEFRAENPVNFARLRDQVRIDMKRIPALDPALIQGYRLIGDAAAADALQAKTGRIKSFSNVFQEWIKAHPDRAGMREASAQWVKDWPDETNAWYWRMNAIAADKASTPLDIQRAGEDVLASNAKTFHGWTTEPYPHAVAQVWIEHDIRLADCIGLLRQARAELDGTSPLRDDRIPATAPAASAPNVATVRVDIWRLEAEAHRKLRQYDDVRAVLAELKTWIDSHPADAAWPLMTWHEEIATLAEAEGNKSDALANYLLGYQRKSSALRARALWTEMGGQPEDFAIWWQRPDPPKTPGAALTPHPWFRKMESLGLLNARDLSGKTWTVLDLQGRKTLINIWATWCIPCREELPAVQKLYDRVKDRKDMQVITIDMDEDPGLLEPFLKTTHYTFPILLAKSLVDEVTTDPGIPRNWIVDADGNLSEEAIGFFPAEWPDIILGKLKM